MTAELWVFPALLLVLLLIGLIALTRGRSRPPLPAPRPRVQTRQIRPAASRPPSRPFEPSTGDGVDTEPDNLDSRREAATEALKLARQRAAAGAARLEALRQSRVQAAGQAPQPQVVTPLRRPLPPARPLLPPRADAQTPSGPPPAGLDRPMPAPVPALVAPVMPTAAASPVARPAGPALQSPMPVPVLVPVPVPVPVPRPPAVAQALAPLLSPAPIMVLVVDDSKVVRIKTSRLLEKHHYKVMLADDGLTALQALAEQWPDLVITDVEMPGLDGFGLTQQLRSQPRGQAMPVIMVSSSNDRHRDAAARAGVSVLLGKPYPEAQLLAEVEKALGRVAQPAPAGLLMQ